MQGDYVLQMNINNVEIAVIGEDELRVSQSNQRNDHLSSEHGL